jgi:hypothetical protein
MWQTRSFRGARLAATSIVAAVVLGCTGGARAVGDVRAAGPPNAAAQPPISNVEGAWRVVETAARLPGAAWIPRPGPQAGFYVFSRRHYSYFYIPGLQPRARFADANRPSEAEKASAYDTFIAGAGTYTFDGVTLALKADLRKNPSEMTGELWRWQAAARGDTLSLVFVDPPFLPGQEWRVTLLRAK